MFTWSHEDSMDIDLPLHKTWNFYTDPTNWPKWEDRFEVCILEGSLTAGSRIRVKIKNKPTYMVIWIAEVIPQQECKFIVKLPFFTQESLCVFEKISPEKTRITMKLCVISFFAPFIKKFFMKNIDSSRSKCLRAFAENAE